MGSQRRTEKNPSMWPTSVGKLKMEHLTARVACVNPFPEANRRGTLGGIIAAV